MKIQCLPLFFLVQEPAALPRSFKAARAALGGGLFSIFRIR